MLDRQYHLPRREDGPLDFGARLSSLTAVPPRQQRRQVEPSGPTHHAAARLRGWMGLADQRWAEAVGADSRPAGPPKAAAWRWRRPAARTARRLVHGAARRRATPGELSARRRLGGDSQMALQRKPRYFEVPVSSSTASWRSVNSRLRRPQLRRAASTWHPLTRPDPTSRPRIQGSTVSLSGTFMAAPSSEGRCRRSPCPLFRPWMVEAACRWGADADRRCALGQYVSRLAANATGPG
jgi:hypothetical protein